MKRMRKELQEIIHSKYFIWPVLLLSSGLVFIFVYYGSISDQVLYPNLEQYNCASYTDAVNAGHSQVTDFQCSDSLIRFTYQLKPGFSSPYVGLSFTPRFAKSFDASRYNQIVIKLAGEGVNRIGLALYTPPVHINGRQNTDQTIYHKYVSISTEAMAYKLALADLDLPEWWLDMHQFSADELKKQKFDQIEHLNISTAFSSSLDGEKSIQIYDLRFTRNNQVLFLLSGLCYIIGLAFIFLFFYRKSRKLKRVAQRELSYQPLDISNLKSIEETCLRFIETHCFQSDLSMEMITRALAISPKQVSRLIQDQFGCNFKTYINKIRMQEAKRLLVHTDLHMGEIAFKVGFNNQSHFNRVFKNEFESSPSAYRDENRA